MKPWLFDILACPIDKYFPLKLFIFSFETKTEEFQVFLDKYKKRDLSFIKEEKIIEVSRKNDLILIKDNINIEFSSLKSYLELIISSINELDNIFDNTKKNVSKECLNLIRTEIKQKIVDNSKKEWS
ncbi:MAG: hypothetical protein ACFFDH_03285 [Promethearchaeota archaeon]